MLFLKNCDPVITRPSRSLFIMQNLYSSIFCVPSIEYLPFFPMESVSAFSDNSWIFLFFPLILCHGNCHKVESLDFLNFFFSRTNAWNLEPCLGIQLKGSEFGGTISGLELVDRKFNRN